MYVYVCHLPSSVALLCPIVALTPYLEARSFDVNKFFSVLHSVGSIAAVLLYMLMADRYTIRMHMQHGMNLAI